MKDTKAKTTKPTTAKPKTTKPTTPKPKTTKPKPAKPCGCIAAAEWDRLWPAFTRARRRYDESWRRAETVPSERRRRAAALRRAAQAIVKYDTRHGFPSLPAIVVIAREGPSLDLPADAPPKRAPRPRRSASTSAAGVVDSMTDLVMALATE